MPLTPKGKKIEQALVKEYGREHGKQVLFAGRNSGRFTGVDESASRATDALAKAMRAGQQESAAQREVMAVLEGKRR